MAITKSEMDYAKTIELVRFRNERDWPSDPIHVKTWPWIEVAGGRLFGMLNKGTFRVDVFYGGVNNVEQFKSYEELVERWMGD